MKYPFSELAVRDLVRTFPSVLPLLSYDLRRIDVEYSGPHRMAKTYLLVYRSGGTLDDNLSLDTPTLTFQCYGSTRMVAYKLALALAADIADVHLSYVSTVLGTACVSKFTAPTLSYTPDQDHARYTLITTARVYYVSGCTGGIGSPDSGCFEPCPGITATTGCAGVPVD